MSTATIVNGDDDDELETYAVPESNHDNEHDQLRPVLPELGSSDSRRVQARASVNEPQHQEITSTYVNRGIAQSPHEIARGFELLPERDRMHRDLS